LTELEENKDYSWATAYKDIYNVALENERMYKEEVPDAAPYPYEYSIDTFERYLFRGGSFTREIAAHYIYIMMNSQAGKNGESLGDILAEKYGMSDIVLYNNYIRRTDMGKGGVYKNDPGLFHAFSDDEKHLEYIRSRDTEKIEISEEVRALAEEITKGKNTDYKKAEAICEWVSEHIFYDWDHFGGKVKSLQDADTVLRTRKGVCSGYAELTKALMLSCGIECHTEQSDSHEWNVAYIDGKVVFIDNTWECDGLTYRDGKYRENEYTENAAKDYLNPKTSWSKYWFDRDSEDFIASHDRLREPLFITSKSPTER
jgi:transglutaminase-like putative cysteine protease